MSMLLTLLQIDMEDGMVGLAIFSIIFYLAILVLYVAGIWKTFEKAGEPGWAAIIPVYNLIIMNKISRRPQNHVWYILGSMVIAMGGALYASVNMETSNSFSFSNIGWIIYLAGLVLALIFIAKMYKSIATNFGEGIAFAIGLLFLGVIFWPILGFGKRYQYLPAYNQIDEFGRDVDHAS